MLVSPALDHNGKERLGKRCHNLSGELLNDREVLLSVNTSLYHILCVCILECGHSVKGKSKIDTKSSSQILPVDVRLQLMIIGLTCLFFNQVLSSLPPISHFTLCSLICYFIRILTTCL